MALAVYCAFLLIAIAGRIFLHYRLTGDSGVRVVTKKSSVVSKVSSFLLFISFFATFVLTGIDALGRLTFGLTLWSHQPIPGLLICIVGITLTSYSQSQMGRSWRVGVEAAEKTELITTGIYAYIRHPVYSGVMLFGIGLLLLVPNGLMLIALLFGYISIELQVRFVEEPHLLRWHNAKYLLYMRSVGRYLPMLRRAHGN